MLQNSDRVVQPVAPEYDSVGKETQRLIDESKECPSRLYLQEREAHPDIYLQNGKRWLFYRSKLKKIDGEWISGEPLTNLWDDLLSNNLHNEGGVKFPKGKKPEALLKRVFELFSDEGDLVLDSFLGSGTTTAVAQKLQRRFIGVEMGEQARTHCHLRQSSVTDGEQSGVSKAVSWQGGGGFRFFELGPSVFDENGQIQPNIPFNVLASHIWFSETSAPIDQKHNHNLVLGYHEGRAIALLYNGILGDKRPDGGNVLTRKTLVSIREACGKFSGPLLVYGERTALGSASLQRENITFKQTPYDVKARR